jgi:hypothetical protein
MVLLHPPFQDHDCCLDIQILGCTYLVRLPSHRHCPPASIQKVYRLQTLVVELIGEWSDGALAVFDFILFQEAG